MKTCHPSVNHVLWQNSTMILSQKKSNDYSSEPFNLIVSNVHGPLPVCTPSGHQYWITFTDNHTHYCCVYLLKSKDKASNDYQFYEMFAINQTGTRVKRFRDDKGGEYTGNKWNEHFQH